MKNRVVVEICDREYALITEEDENYVRSLGNEIDEFIEKSVYRNLRSTKTDAAILTCLDLLDQNKKLNEANDNMRKQIKEYIDEISALNKRLMKYERQNKKQTAAEDEEIKDETVEKPLKA